MYIALRYLWMSVSVCSTPSMTMVSIIKYPPWCQSEVINIRHLSAKEKAAVKFHDSLKLHIRKQCKESPRDFGKEAPSRKVCEFSFRRIGESQFVSVKELMGYARIPLKEPV